MLRSSSSSSPCYFRPSLTIREASTSPDTSRGLRHWAVLILRPACTLSNAARVVTNAQIVSIHDLVLDGSLEATEDGVELEHVDLWKTWD